MKRFEEITKALDDALAVLTGIRDQLPLFNDEFDSMIKSLLEEARTKLVPITNAFKNEKEAYLEISVDELLDFIQVKVASLKEVNEEENKTRCIKLIKGYFDEFIDETEHWLNVTDKFGEESHCMVLQILSCLLFEVVNSTSQINVDKEITSSSQISGWNQCETDILTNSHLQILESFDACHQLKNKIATISNVEPSVLNYIDHQIEKYVVSIYLG